MAFGDGNALLMFISTNKGLVYRLDLTVSGEEGAGPPATPLLSC